MTGAIGAAAACMAFSMVAMIKVALTSHVFMPLLLCQTNAIAMGSTWGQHTFEHVRMFVESK